jgi:hypothetical protein
VNTGLDKEIKSRKLKEKGFNENGLEKNKERYGSKNKSCIDLQELCEYIENEKGKVPQRKIKICGRQLELTENKNEN